MISACNDTHFFIWKDAHDLEGNCGIIQKGKAVILAGYHFEIWIFNSEKDLEPYKITSSNGIEEFEKECVRYYHNMFGSSQLPDI